jgi:hypothetical protein
METLFLVALQKKKCRLSWEWLIIISRHLHKNSYRDTYIWHCSSYLLIEVTLKKVISYTLFLLSSTGIHFLNHFFGSTLQLSHIPKRINSSLQPWRWRQYIPRICWYHPTRLHYFLTQNTRIWAIAVMRTSQLPLCSYHFMLLASTQGVSRL